ncbi:hypothetical protein IIA79_01020 [bacterium]|nr:hypothetical protein [bacterium]
MRVLILAGVAVGLLLPALWLAQPAHCAAYAADDFTVIDTAQDDTPEDEDQPEEEPPQGEDESGDGETSSEDEEEKEAPEGVRRRRPRTGEEERKYKLRKIREDPFLDSADPVQDAGEVYNPGDWLLSEVPQDLSRYIVQDEGGGVLGYLTVNIEFQSNPVLGDFIQLTLIHDHQRAEKVEIWLFAGTLKPRKKVSTQLILPSNPSDSSGGGGAANEPLFLEDMPRLTVDYLFDRVTVQEEAGLFSTSRKFRQLPFSFDIDELCLIVRQLDFLNADWPFEAAVTLPSKASSSLFQVEAPERVEVLSAEPANYSCFEVSMSIDGEPYTWWVQRAAPHRLVKYTDGELTFTLYQYTVQR